MSKIQRMKKRSDVKEKESELDNNIYQKPNSEKKEFLDQNKESEQVVLLLEEER